MLTEAQKRANNKYKKENMRTITFMLHKRNDADIIDFLDKQPNKSETIKRLLRIEASKR